MRPLLPRLHPEIFVFCVVPHNSDYTYLNPVASCIESEGVTLIITRETADQYEIRYGNLYVRITLEANSSLQDFGLTALFSKALAEAGIPCNVIAGYHHDHLFVPESQSTHAMAILHQLKW